MNRNTLAIGLTFGFVLALAVGKGEAGEIPFKGGLSGTGVSTEMDIDGVGEKNTLLAVVRPEQIR